MYGELVSGTKGRAALIIHELDQFASICLFTPRRYTEIISGQFDGRTCLLLEISGSLRLDRERLRKIFVSSAGDVCCETIN